MKIFGGLRQVALLCVGLSLALAGCTPSNTQEIEPTENKAEKHLSAVLAEQQTIAPRLAESPVFKASGFINQGPYEKDRKQIYRVGHDYFIINFDHGGILLMASLREPIIKYVTQDPTPKAPSSRAYKISNNLRLSLHGSLNDTQNCASYFATVSVTEATNLEFGVLVFEDDLGQRKILITKYYRDGCPEQKNVQGRKFTLQSLLNHYRTMDINYISETEITVEITQHPFLPRLNQK